MRRIVGALVGGTGFQNGGIRQAAKLLEFPSVEKLVGRYVAATPLAAILARADDDVRAASVDDVASVMKECVSAAALAFPIESHLLLAAV